MPELPEVESVVRGLHDDVVGRTFTGFTCLWPRQIAPLMPEDFAARLVGQRIEALRRRAKYLVFDLSRDVLLVHLKMTGRLYVGRQALDRWVRATFGLEDGRTLYFSDSRKFGRLYLVTHETEITGGLGLEPLSEAFTLEAWQDMLAERQGMIKPLLLDQRFIAGIGNIYADEALWQARIAPQRKVGTLKQEEIARLHQAIRDVLLAGIEHEGASVNWYRKPDGTVGEQQNYFNVYDRVEQPCPRCGHPIHKIRLGQRGTHFCPGCQV